MAFCTPCLFFKSVHCFYNIHTCIYTHTYTLIWGFPGGTVVKNLPDNAGDAGSVPGSGRSAGEEMATHSSILAWEIPWTEEPGWLQSTASGKGLGMHAYLTHVCVCLFRMSL